MRTRQLLALLLALPFAACRAEVTPVPEAPPALAIPEGDARASGDSAEPEAPGMVVAPPPHESEDEMTRAPPPHPGDDDMVTVPSPVEPQPPRPAPRQEAREVQR